MMVETILESSQDFGMSNGSLPQWKRELLQRRALRVRPAAPAPAPPPPPPPLPPPVDEDDEELRYGPGIVKRLKSRYLSLALRDAPRRRPSVLRRAASLEHLLDERPPPAPRPARAPRPASIAAPPPHPRRDFVKRARSVDALSRLEEAPSPPPAPRPVAIAPAPPAPPVNRAPRPPRRPAPLLRDAERPPPDVVKSTLRKFESVPTRRAAPAARVSAVVRGLEAPRRSITPDREPSPPVSPAPAPLSPAPRSPSQSPVPAPMTPPPPTSPASPPMCFPRAPSPPSSSPSPVPAPARLDPVSARFDPIPARPDSVPARFDPIPARLDPAPVRFDPIPARLDSASARLDSAPARLDLSPARLDPAPARLDLAPARSDLSPARLDPAPARLDPAPARLDSAPMEDEFGSNIAINETEMSSPCSRVVSRAALEGIARAGSSVRYAFEAARGGSHLPPLAASNPVLVARRVGVIRPMPAVPRTPATPTPVTNGRRSPPPAPAPAQAERPPWARAVGRPRAPATSQTTSIVFNFSSRKEVPDYIENDGIVLRSSRRPNLKVTAGESGAEESDCEADGPVSPLRVRFVNDNVLINGRSSMLAARGDHRDNQRQAKLKLQFDDSLTVTHEYPSETSLVADDSPPPPAPAPAPPPAAAPPPAPAPPDASALADNTHIASAALSRYAPSKTCAAAAPLGLAPQPAAPHHALNNNGVEHSPAAEAGAGEQWEAAPWSAARALATDLLF